MSQIRDHQVSQSRRTFLTGTAGGVGSVSLASLMDPTLCRAAPAAPATSAGKWTGVLNPLHLAPRAKRVIHLYQAGGPSENRVSVHDLHATMLHVFGIDHTRFRVRFQGLDFGLSGVEHPRVWTEILS